MTTPVHPADLRAVVYSVLRRTGSAQEVELIRDIALVVAGARPSAYVWEAGPAIGGLLDEVERAGIVVRRWVDPGYGRYAAVARSLNLAEAVADLAEHEMREQLSARDEGDLGQLLGYPVPSILAYIRTDGGRTGDLLSEQDWTPDERRFLLCRHGPTPAEAAVGRAWANDLLSSFRAAFGEEALELLPVHEPHALRRA